MIEYENLRKVNEKLFVQYQSAFTDVLESGWYILGESVTNFEREFATYTGADFCAGVANGLDALVISLRVLDLEPGAEVIVPSNTYIATILSIVQSGLTPVLVEPDLATYNIDPDKIEEKITKRTRAIMVVHLYGKLCNMEAINAVAVKHGLYIVEDCAQAHGASYNGKRAGSFGHFGAFSFYPTKNLGAIGDAGAITCNDKSLDGKVRTFRNYGSQIKYQNEVVGYNSRLDELQAALLTVKLKVLDDITNHKRRLAAIYHAGLDNKFIKPVIQEGYYDVYHIYNIRHEKRDLIRAHLLEHNIKTEIHYPIPPVKQKAMKGILSNIETPIANEIHNTTLSLPISYFHTEAEIQSVIQVLNSFQL